MNGEIDEEGYLCPFISTLMSSFIHTEMYFYIYSLKERKTVKLHRNRDLILTEQSKIAFRCLTNVMLDKEERKYDYLYTIEKLNCTIVQFKRNESECWAYYILFPSFTLNANCIDSFFY